MTISFSICTTSFIYSKSIPPEWNSLFVPPNITVSSIMACRLFRELKLGHFIDPMTDRAISKIIIRDIGTMPQEEDGHDIDDDEGVDAGVGRQRSFGRDQIFSDMDIEVQAR
jgi:hypothetical protein